MDGPEGQTTKKNQSFSRCRTAPRCGFSIFEITRCGSVRFLFIENRTVQCGFHFFKIIRRGAVRIFKIIRLGAVRCGAVRCGAVRCGAVRCGAVRRGVVRYGVVRLSVEQ